MGAFDRTYQGMPSTIRHEIELMLSALLPEGYFVDDSIRGVDFIKIKLKDTLGVKVSVKFKWKN